MLQLFLEKLEPRLVFRCLRCLLLVMCTYPFAKKALTLHLACGEGRERYFGCNSIQRKVLASSHQHLMAEAPSGGSALLTASRTIRRCTPNFLATPTIVPTPCSYSRRICSNNRTLAPLSNRCLLSGLTPAQGYRSDAGGPNLMSEMGQVRVANTTARSSPRSRFEPAVRTLGGPVARHPQPRGRKPALLARYTLDSARIPRASKPLICGLFQKGRVLAQDGRSQNLSSQRYKVDLTFFLGLRGFVWVSPDGKTV